MMELQEKTSEKKPFCPKTLSRWEKNSKGKRRLNVRELDRQSLVMVFVGKWVFCLGVFWEIGVLFSKGGRAMMKSLLPHFENKWVGYARLVQQTARYSLPYCEVISSQVGIYGFSGKI